MSDDVSQNLVEAMRQRAEWSERNGAGQLAFEYRAVADELARLRAIVRDLAANNYPSDNETGDCVLCGADWDWLEKRLTHTAGCPWLRATQEAERA